MVFPRSFILGFPFTSSMILTYKTIKLPLHGTPSNSFLPRLQFSIKASVLRESVHDSYQLRNVLHLSSTSLFWNSGTFYFLHSFKKNIYWEHIDTVTSFNKKCVLLSLFTDEETSFRKVMWCSQDNVNSMWMIWG